MKTNQIMSRPMGQFYVLQRTKDGMFNATELLKQWNKNYNSEKTIAHYFENGATNEFIRTIESKENFTCRNSVYVKSRASRGNNAGTWMHPMLFIDFAMWINPSFKYDVLKFVYDEMIKYRNDAGDAYRELSSSVKRLVPDTFMPSAMQEIGKALNFIVFNEHERGMRNKHGDEIKQKELFMLESKIADLVNEGFIKNFEDLMNYLRKRWHTKYSPKVFNRQIIA